MLLMIDVYKFQSPISRLAVFCLHDVDRDHYWNRKNNRNEQSAFFLVFFASYGTSCVVW